MDRGKALMTPLSSYVKLSKLNFPQSNEQKVEMDKLLYAFVCGILRYVIIATSSNIVVAVGVVRKHVSNPNKKH